MEIPNTSTCQTCLGASDLPINLLDSCHKDYLEILQRLLGLQLFVEGGQFIICNQCHGKIIWVSNFQISCLKSLQHLGNVNCKTELEENEEVPSSQTQSIQEIEIDRAVDVSGGEDNYSDASDSEQDYIPERRESPCRSITKYTRTTRSSEKIPAEKSEIQSTKVKSEPLHRKGSIESENEDTEDSCSSNGNDNSDSDGDCGINKTSKKRKRKEKKKDKPLAKGQRGNRKEKVKLLRLQQFPANEVLEAIQDYRSYVNDIKKRRCVLCDYVGPNAGILHMHIGRNHEKEYIKWCKHCNIVTNDLQEHRDSVKCYEKKCKLCGDIFTTIKYLKQHLQQHCRAKLFQPAVDKLERRTSMNEPMLKLCEKYPESDVLKAIAECSAYMTNLKTRSCLYCDFVAPTSRMLSVHVSFKHKEEYRNWCCRCNLSSDDLQLHIKTTKCNENRCVFCKKTFIRVNNLTTHLKLHCRTLIKTDEDVDQDDMPHTDLEDDPTQSDNAGHLDNGATANEAVKNNKLNQNLKWRPCDKFPKEQVLKAIVDATAYKTDMKNRKCIYCHFTAHTSRKLSTHMRKAHKTYFSSWCNRCNLQTNDLKSHLDSTKCFENQCVLCRKMFVKLKRLTEHLKRHCHGRFGLPGEILDNSEETVTMEENDLLSGNTGLADLGLNYMPNDPQSNVKPDFDMNAKKHHRHFFFKRCLEPKEIMETVEATRSSTAKARNRSPRTPCKTQKQKSADGPIDNDSSYVNDKSSDKDCSITRKTRKRKRKGKSNESDGGKRFRLKQYPAEEVSEAIDDCRSYINDIKYKQCIFCDYVGADGAILQLHVYRKHVNEYINWCRFCNLATPNLQEHKDDIKCYQQKCIFCGDTFSLIKYLKVHLQQHCRSKFFQPAVDKLERQLSKAEPKTYKLYPESEILDAIDDCSAYMTDLKNRTCLQCDFVASTSRMLSFHLKAKHIDEFKNWCARCNLHSDDLHSHVKTSKCNEYRCVFCKRLFLKLHNLTTHLKLHCHVEGKELFTCKNCPASFSQEQDLERHECEKVDPVVTCTLCHRRVGNMREHMYRRHTPKSNKPKMTGITPKKRVCPICGKTFFASYLAAHMYAHTGEMPFKCSFCGKGFAVISILKIHEMRHSGEKQFECLVCGKGFVTKSEHKLHIPVHEGGPVQCTVCKKEFSRPGVLKLHMRRHTGENQFSCVDCGMSFHRKSLLLNHLRRHKNERPFKCSFCEKDFTETSTLRKHERIHTGVKPYKCSICSFSCVQSHGLTLHMKQHPEDAPQVDRPYKCFFCHRQFTTKAMLMSHTNIHHNANAPKNNMLKKVV